MKCKNSLKFKVDGGQQAHARHEKNKKQKASMWQHKHMEILVYIKKHKYLLQSILLFICNLKGSIDASRVANACQL